MAILAVVPTAGNQFVNGEYTPTEQGVCRLHTLAETLKANPDMEGAIIGGHRVKWENNEALVYWRWFQEIFPEQARQVQLVLHDFAYTVADMKQLVNVVDHCGPSRPTGLLIITHRDHFAVAVQPLRKLLGDTMKIALKESGEEHPYSKAMCWILIAVTYLDPLWEKFWTGMLRLKAQERIFLDSD